MNRLDWPRYKGRAKDKIARTQAFQPSELA
jgi:hypothetical protein